MERTSKDLTNTVIEFTGADGAEILRLPDSDGYITYITFKLQTEYISKMANDEFFKRIDERLESSNYVQKKLAQAKIRESIMLNDIEQLRDSIKDLEKYKTFYELYRGLHE